MLPAPRGPLSELLLEVLSQPPGDLPPVKLPSADALQDEDLQLSLYLCYELHYRGLPGVDELWEWQPSLIGLRNRMEDVFTAALTEAVPVDDDAGETIDVALRALAADVGGVSLSRFIRASATLEQVREFVVHRSAYQLKEADPHSWALPRLAGPAKAAFVEIQYDEYGSGRPDWVHAELFARAMRALGLDDAYGAYLDRIPGVTLATVNLMSMFGLHRRWRGAIVGHLALFEMTSSIPNRRYGDGLRRLGQGPDATRFFDEHVTADAVHESIACVDLAGGLLQSEPGLRPSLLWGARTLDFLEARWARHLLASWELGGSSLRAPLERGAALPI